MTWNNSLAMACTAANQDASNRLMEALFRGPNTFSRPIRDKVTLARVAYAAHTYDDDLVELFVNQVIPAGVTLARIQSFGFATVAAAKTAAANIKFKVVADRESLVNIKSRLDDEGWEFEPVALT